MRVSSRTALRLTLGGCRGRDLIQTGNTMNDENENTNAPDPATSSEATGDENTLPAKWDARHGLAQSGRQTKNAEVS